MRRLGWWQPLAWRGLLRGSRLHPAEVLLFWSEILRHILYYMLTLSHKAQFRLRSVSTDCYGVVALSSVCVAVHACAAGVTPVDCEGAPALV